MGRWRVGPGVAYLQRPVRYAKCMTVRDMLTALQTLPRDAELLAFEAGPLGLAGEGRRGRAQLLQ